MDCLCDPSGLWCISHLNLLHFHLYPQASVPWWFLLNVCWSFVNGSFAPGQKVLLCKCQRGLCWFSTSRCVRDAYTHWHTLTNTHTHSSKAGFSDGFIFFQLIGYQLYCTSSEWKQPVGYPHRPYHSASRPHDKVLCFSQ